MISRIPLVVLGLGTRMSDPCVYVVFWAPREGFPKGPARAALRTHGHNNQRQHGFGDLQFHIGTLAGPWRLARKGKTDSRTTGPRVWAPELRCLAGLLEKGCRIGRLLA